MGGFKKFLRKVHRTWTSKSTRKKLGLTAKNKHMRQLRRSIGLGSRALASPVSTSASTEGYQYQPRTLSMLTGGV